jgi:hypothetical protein
VTCIYCGDTDPGQFQGVEHVVPQSFGTYGSSTPTLACVCDGCNAYFGRELDQLLTRDTIEGISRYARGQRSRESRPQRRLSIALAEGPEAGPFAGMRVAVDGTTGTLMRPRAQFHVFNFETQADEVYFLNQIASLTLPEAIYGAPGSATRRWRSRVIAATREEHDEMVAALQAQGIAFVPGEPFQLPEGFAQTGGSVPATIEGEVDTLHKRALTKILLNFVAWSLGRDEALTAKWNCLRNYVRRAEGEIKARLTERPFWNGQETEEQRFVDDSIDIRVENRDGNIVGALQFYGRFTYEFILAENEVLPPDKEVGYRFTPGEAPIRGEKRRIDPPGGVADDPG